jgi:hypothetical protein
MIKCVGCSQLKRKEIVWKGQVGVVRYDCPEFKYMCVLSGLLRPSKEMAYAAQHCGIDTNCCVVCGEKATQTYGYDPVIARACKKHDAEWRAWLDKNDPGRQRLSPKGKPRRNAWVELFREFAESCRTK